jgi:hypothetical protein
VEGLDEAQATQGLDLMTLNFPNVSRDNLGEKSGNLDENRWIAERVNDCRLSHQAQAVFVS